MVFDLNNTKEPKASFEYSPFPDDQDNPNYWKYDPIDLIVDPENSNYLIGVTTDCSVLLWNREGDFTKTLIQGEADNSSITSALVSYHPDHDLEYTQIKFVEG